MKKLIVYDDSKIGNELVQDVIGNKHFGEIVVKRKSLECYFREFLNKIYLGDYQWKKLYNEYDIYQIHEILKRYSAESKIKILHYFSNHVITNKSKMEVVLEKLTYINENIALMYEQHVVGIMFYNMKSYLDYLNFVSTHHSVEEALEEFHYEQFLIKGISNLRKIENLIQCVTGNFDSRFFNSLQGDDNFITKCSKNKIKIKREYTFWQLLPEDMKVWFVQPFNFYEDEKYACYTMKRYHMTDLAIKWVHGSVEKEEFIDILQYYFLFFNSRHSKEINQVEYDNMKTELYEKKVLNRIFELENNPNFKEIEKYVSIGTKYKSLQNILDKYFELKEKLEKGVEPHFESVIGHGDPCFANTIYNRITRTMLFIDPKGALTEEELWTNPYYDIAKLSHSVCGLYDFFNTGLFNISIKENFQLQLTIEFDNETYKEIFKKILEKNGYNYNLVRIYEASLFLSMLPLHIDYPYKVLGFLLNAIRIMEEIENAV